MYATASNILGPWQTRGNPCIGPEADKTFRSQSTFVLPAPGERPGAFIYMGDRWMPGKLGSSPYVWLPFTIRPDGTFTLQFHERWDLTIFDTLR